MTKITWRGEYVLGLLHEEGECKTEYLRQLGVGYDIIDVLNNLERDGYIKITKVGRRNRYKINAKARFRHPAESHQSVAALLGIFAD